MCENTWERAVSFISLPRNYLLKNVFFEFLMIWPKNQDWWKLKWPRWKIFTHFFILKGDYGYLVLHICLQMIWNSCERLILRHKELVSQAVRDLFLIAVGLGSWAFLYFCTGVWLGTFISWDVLLTLYKRCVPFSSNKHTCTSQILMPRVFCK